MSLRNDLKTLVREEKIRYGSLDQMVFAKKKTDSENFIANALNQDDLSAKEILKTIIRIIRYCCTEPDEVRKLLNTPDQILNGNTPLMEMFAKGHLKSIEYFYHFMDINKQNPLGSTALMEAVKNNRTDCIKLLLKANPNLEIENKYQMTALDIAISKKNIPLMVLLLKAGSQIHRPHTMLNTIMEITSSSYTDFYYCLKELCAQQDQLIKKNTKKGMLTEEHYLKAKSYLASLPRPFGDWFSQFKAAPATKPIEQKLQKNSNPVIRKF